MISVVSRLLVPLLLVCSVFSANTFAQDGKPTKEQTIKYIVDHYPSSIHWYGQKENAPPRSGLMDVDHEVEGISFVINNSLVKISYENRLEHNYRSIHLPGGASNKKGQEIISVEFDLATIEEIEGVALNGISFKSVNIFRGDVNDSRYKDVTAYLPISLWFKASGSQKLIKKTVDGESTMVSEVAIPFSSYDANKPERAEWVKDNQIFKALNHLRKLVGAPEPLQFD